MSSPLRLKSLEATEPAVLTPLERTTKSLRELGAITRTARVVDLGQATPGICLNLTDEDREELLDELEPAIQAVFDGTSTFAQTPNIAHEG